MTFNLTFDKIQIHACSFLLERVLVVDLSYEKKEQEFLHTSYIPFFNLLSVHYFVCLKIPDLDTRRTSNTIHHGSWEFDLLNHRGLVCLLCVVLLFTGGSSHFVEVSS